MTDHTDHRASAEGELLNALGYVHDADLSKADRAYQSINFALVHALLAIHDTLANLKPKPTTYPWPSTLPGVDAADRYAANEARQREAAPEPDPLDEDDHRDRLTADRLRIVRNGRGHWHWHTPAIYGKWCTADCTEMSLRDWAHRFGPLAFAPDAAQQPPSTATSADEGTEGREPTPEADGPKLNAQTRVEPLLCVECEHLIDYHTRYVRCEIVRCPCLLQPSDIARKLIEQAVAQATGADRPVTLPEGWTLTGPSLSHRGRGHVGWVVQDPSDNSWLSLPTVSGSPRQWVGTKQAAVDWIIEQTGGGRG